MAWIHKYGQKPLVVSTYKTVLQDCHNMPAEILNIYNCSVSYHYTWCKPTITILGVNPQVNIISNLIIWTDLLKHVGVVNVYALKYENNKL